MSTSIGNPWDASAPERAGLPSAFGLLPEDLAAMGAPGRPELLFTRLQRPWSWSSESVPASKAQKAWLGAATDGFVPEILESHPSDDGSTKVVLRLADGERLLVEYVLMAGENDTLEDADRLADWLGDLRTGHNINLIRMNEHASSSFREPAEVRLQAFLERLKARGCFVTVRKSRGRDVQGACGQLLK